MTEAAHADTWGKMSGILLRVAGFGIATLIGTAVLAVPYLTIH